MKITYGDKVYESSEPIKVNDLLKNEVKKEHIACIVNNQVHALDYEIRHNSKVELITAESKDGRGVYIRGILYIMGKAFHDVAPDCLLSVNYQLHNAMYCQVDNKVVTKEIIDKVRARMKEIIKNDIPITKSVMTLDEAKTFYKQSKSSNGKFQLNKRSKNVSLDIC